MADENSIAIIGMAGHFPGARSISEYWSMLEAGRDATRWLSTEELLAAGESLAAIEDARYVRATMPLPDMEMFDAGFFGFSPREASILDPQHRHFIECCWEALEDAGHAPTENFDGAIGVFGGCGMQAYMAFNLLTNPELVEREGMFLLRHAGNDKDFLTTRVSYLLNLHGPSLNVQTACSTSLVAIHVACQSLLARECDMALAGGSSIDLPHGRGYRYAEGEILSSTGRCRAFDDAADGTLFGSGAAVVALRRLDDALRDGDNIHAVILGSAVNNDGARKAGYLAPSVDGQATAAAEALAIAGVSADSVDYIEAHGTGTLVGDPIELAGLQQAYGDAPAGSIGIGSVKTNIGHLDTAAGIASLIKVVLAMRGEALPATLNFSSPNSRFDFARSPFDVVGQKRDWHRGTRVRRASVNSLGVGGTNAHVVLEEAPVRPAVPASGPQIITLSAKTPGALEGLVAKWRAFAAAPGSDFSLANAAYTTQVGRKAFACRAAVVASDAQELAEKLAPNGAWKRSVATATETKPRIVFMFPGGGAQHPNAARALYERNRAFREAVETCFAILEPGLASELRGLMFEADNVAEAAAALERPTNSLLAVFIVEYALSRLWESWGVTPDAVIGHSAGEYAAAVLAGIMSLQDAIAVVLERGAVFEAAPAGGMVSVQESEARVRALLGDDLDVAVLNAPQVTVVSGALEPLAAFSKRVEAEGIKHAPVRIKVAAHSRMLDGGLEQFRSRFQTIALSAPKIEFINNLTGKPALTSELTTSDYWVSHLRGCVRFADGLSEALSAPNTILVEVGPGQALCALAGLADGPHEPLRVVATLPAPVEQHDEEAFALSAFASLWTLGVPIDFSRVRKEDGLRRVSLPTYAFERRRHWIEPGQGPAVSSLPAAPQLIRRTNVSDWFETRVFEPAPQQAAVGQGSRSHVIFSDGTALAAKLIERLRARGDACVVVAHARGSSQHSSADAEFTFDASKPDYTPLIDALSAAGVEPDTLVFLWPLIFARAGAGFGAFDATFALTKALQLSGWGERARFMAVTQNALAVDEDETCDARQAGVLGPWRMLAAEQAGVRTTVVDIDASDSEADRAEEIFRELDMPGDAPTIAWRHGVRFAPVLRPIATPPPCEVLREEGVYLITGGLGGIGLELARYLALTVRARLVLTGRAPVPPREGWSRLAAGWGDARDVVRARELLELEALGAQVLAVSADVADAVAMEGVLVEARSRFGDLHGIFHAAGLIDDTPMAMKAHDEAHRVLAPKAAGALVLDALAPDGTLDIFAVFSSSSVLIAPPGQSDYVAANAIAEAVAASRRDGRVITWGVWADTGMAKRAADADAAGNADTGHPLLGARQDAKEGVLQFVQTYSEAVLWPLSEHRVSDIAVLPGAAYVEIARAAALSAGLGDAIEIGQLSLIAPLTVGPRQSRQVRTTLTPLDDERYRIEVESRAHAGEAWVLHFDARLEGCESEPEQLMPLSCDTELDAGQLTLTERGVAFGPRWGNVIRAALGEQAVSADFALPQDFAGDLEIWRIHPALFDTSMACGLFLLEHDAREGVFAPVSITSVRIFGNLGGAFSADCRMTAQNGDAATFDVDLKNTSGTVLVEIRGASFRRVGFGGELPAVADPSASMRDRLLAAGIRASEAPAVFERLFAQDARSVVVSPVSIAQAALALRPSGTPESALPNAAAESTDSGNGDALEQRLMKMCVDILGVDTLGPDDEFLSYGGGSLTGVRLFARIRRELGVELALSALLQAPTIRTLTTLVREHMPELPAAEQGDAPVHITEAASAAPAVEVKPLTVDPPAANPVKKPAGRSRWTPLIQMHKGEASRKPVFIIHGMGGTVVVFKPLADNLRGGFPIYAFEAQGIDGTLPPLESIEEMAALYIRHMQTVDPSGPYRLIGYSGGGVIALEMARQLTHRGREVELLVMLDTLTPEAANRPIQVGRELKRFGEKVQTWVRLSPEELRRRAVSRTEKIYNGLVDLVKVKEPPPPKSHIEVLSDLCAEAYLRAQKVYDPGKYDGDIVLFRAELAMMIAVRAGRLLGWDDVVTGKIDLITLQGADHHSLLAEPTIHVIVEEIQRRLTMLDAKRTRMLEEV